MSPKKSDNSTSKARSSSKRVNKPADRLKPKFNAFTKLFEEEQYPHEGSQVAETQHGSQDLQHTHATQDELTSEHEPSTENNKLTWILVDHNTIVPDETKEPKADNIDSADVDPFGAPEAAVGPLMLQYPFGLSLFSDSNELLLQQPHVSPNKEIASDDTEISHPQSGTSDEIVNYHEWLNTTPDISNMALPPAMDASAAVDMAANVVPDELTLGPNNGAHVCSPINTTIAAAVNTGISGGMGLPTPPFSSTVHGFSDSFSSMGSVTNGEEDELDTSGANTTHNTDINLHPLEDTLQTVITQLSSLITHVARNHNTHAREPRYEQLISQVNTLHNDYKEHVAKMQSNINERITLLFNHNHVLENAIKARDDVILQLSQHTLIISNEIAMLKHSLYLSGIFVPGNNTFDIEDPPHSA